MKPFFFLLALLLLSPSAFPQSRDSSSATQKFTAYQADKFTTRRTLNLEFTQLGAYDFTSRLRSGAAALLRGRVSHMSQASANININFIQTRKWILGASFNYHYTGLKADFSEPVTGPDQTGSISNDYHYHNSSLNLTRISRLWNKPMVYYGSIAVDGSEKGFERVKGLASASMVLKSNAETKIAVGLFVTVDRSSQIPVMPVFSYEHKLGDGYLLDIALPRNVLIRKHVFGNGRISLGTEISRTNFYLYHLDNTGKIYEYNQGDINNGFIYEHLLFKDFILSLKGGVRISPNARIFDRDKSVSDYIFETKPDPTAYLNLGISLNPFRKKR
ncbi:hypothetical protein SAMN05192529_12144 [Arachidicoccus rhizosphaerae]|uniref:DUF6268 domain-containing protein n=1 Tax=Arachidicoccus rhizosphaerae TaxID=551991 RepID=A0A1H4BH22_9BACT|nr:DUF6268 family outer membrane beta-barrel protein [Arachidicoccus rhizosphaerae]SEA47515.1 hypothetical protein SAMN05192529_12144 [Arachidicoccus rhizosphaerae]